MEVKLESSNFQVIQQLINAMLGGAMLILPILFNQGGIVLSFFVLSISGVICYQTCSLYLSHIKDSEIDIEYLIRRVLGETWYNIYVFLSSFYLFLLSILYYMLMVDIFFSIIQFSLEINKIPHESYMGDKLDLKFDKLGYFWISMILFVPVSFMVFIKDLRKIQKITEYGVYCIYIFVAFIFYVFIDNIANQRLQKNIDRVKLFTWDIGHLAGTCSLAFNMHTCMISILRQQNDHNSQQQNLKKSYFIGFLLYFSIGFIGGLGIIGRDVNSKSPQSITDFFGHIEVSPVIIELLYFANLLTVLPCFFSIFKERILNYIFQQKQIPDSALIVVNISYLGLSIIVTNMPSIKSGDLMSANGAISCFFIVYVIPIMIHFRCFYGVQKSKQNVTKEPFVSMNYYDEPLDRDSTIIEINLDLEESLVVSEQECCNDHIEIDKYPIYLRVLMYGTMLLIGTTVFIYGIYNIFIREDDPLNHENTLKGQQDIPEFDLFTKILL